MVYKITEYSTVETANRLWPNIPIIKPTRCTNFSNLFLEWNYMFRTVPLSIPRSFFLLYTQQWYMSYSLLCVQWKTPDDGQRNCPKHVAFHYKNKFEKLVHRFDFIRRIIHDARSQERQMWPKSSNYFPASCWERILCTTIFLFHSKKQRNHIYNEKNHPDAKTCDKNTQWVKLTCAKQERHTQEDRQFVGAIYDTSSIT